MSTYTARSKWTGSLSDGQGELRVGSDTFQTAIAPQTREGEVTNPEEVLGAALAGCYSMALTKTLEDAGCTVDRVSITADVNFQPNEGEQSATAKIDLYADVKTDDVDVQKLQSLAETAEGKCAVARTLDGAEINVEANLASN